MRNTIILSLAVMLLLSGCISECAEGTSPVCGSDGQNYGDPCLAKQAGASVGYEGECIECYDSDSGKKIFTAGSVQSGGESDADFCIDTETITEYYCEGSDAMQEEVACPEDYVCIEGACHDSGEVIVEQNCKDSDGEDVSNAGSVNYEENTYEDSCLDSSTVLEQVCVEDAAAEKEIACPGEQVCFEGACVSSVCEDADGEDMYTAGTATKFPDEEVDVCIDSTSGTEYLCKGGEISSSTFVCPEGWRCSDGHCVAGCSDSDAGMDYDVRGTVSSGGSEETDECKNDKTLMEYYCASNSEYAVTEFTCSGQCDRGRCEAYDCDDSDGGKDRYEEGTVTVGPEDWEDTCKNDEEVKEYYCDHGDVESDTLSCGMGYVCDDGACEPECEDSDGGDDTEVHGTVYFGDDEYEDECPPEGGESVEYYCEDGEVESQMYMCADFHGCNDEMVCAPRCTETDDGADYYDSGTTRFGFDVYNDVCEMVKFVEMLKEYSCVNDFEYDWEWYNCGNGYECAYGECRETCTDTDGTNKYNQGTVYYGNEVLDDYCDKMSGDLREAICFDDVGVYITLSCGSGEVCSGGKCVFELVPI